MLLLVLVLTSVALVPVFGGRPQTLAEMRLRGIGLLLAALALQVALVLFPGEENVVRIAAYIGSYLFAGGFLVFNRQIPGLWLMALGAALNFSAIVANGGVMPAAPHAIATAGLQAHLSVYSNSIPLEAPQLALLGDIFAIPASWPFSNVFSIGDVCIAIGAVVTVHRTTGSRLVPDGSGRFLELVSDRELVLGAVGKALSALAGWTIAGALVLRMAERAATVSDLLGGTAILFSVGLGLLVVSRGAIVRAASSGLRQADGLVGLAEIVRVLAILWLAATAAPSILSLSIVAGCLGATAAPLRLAGPGTRRRSDPAREISEDSVRMAITGLAVLGAVPLAATLFHAGSGSFAILGIAPAVAGLLFAGRARPAELTDSSATSERSTAPVHPITWLAFVACAGLAAAIPLQPAFGGLVLSAEIQIPAVLGVIGFATGVFGAGFLLGAVAMPALSSRVPPVRLLPLGLAALALLVPAAGARSVSGLLFAWFGAGIVLALVIGGARAIARSSANADPVRVSGMIEAAGAAGLLIGVAGSALLSLWVDFPIVLVVGMTVVLTCAFVAQRRLGHLEEHEVPQRHLAQR